MDWSKFLEPQTLVPIITTILSVVIAYLKYKGKAEAAAALETAKKELGNIGDQLKRAVESWDKADAVNSHLVKMIDKAKKDGVSVGDLTKLIMEEGSKLNFGTNGGGDPITVEDILNKVVKTYTE